MTIDEAKTCLRTILAALPAAPPEAGWILQDVLDQTPAEFALAGECSLTPDAFARARHLAERRARGEPLQYVLGNADFYGRRFLVGPGVLIPRPETEQMVDLALKLPLAGGDICDVCTGSGVIAITMALELGGRSLVVGTDISGEALVWAEKNKVGLNCPDVVFLQGDLLAPLPPNQRFDLVIGNPPYIADSDFAHLPGEVRDYEPQTALLADRAGLAILERIADESRDRLLAGGWLVCEMGEEQGPRIRSTLNGLGYKDVDICRDLSGRERFVSARWQGV